MMLVDGGGGKNGARWCRGTVLARESAESGRDEAGAANQPLTKVLAAFAAPGRSPYCWGSDPVKRPIVTRASIENEIRAFP